MTNKEKYIEFCQTSGVYVSIFSQPWWLEAVSEGNWDVLIAEENGMVLAFNPYFFIPHNEGLEIRKAPLTQNNGVILNYPAGLKYERKLAFERKALRMIIDQLEQMPLVSYRQYFHHSFTNWLPYFWKGFSQSTRYTYIIEERDGEIISQNMSAKLRNQIKKAEKNVCVFEDMSIEAFYEFNKKTYERQNMDIPYSFDIVSRIDDACRKRGAAKILYAIDSNDNMHSAIYLVEDAKAVYYLLSGSDERYRDSQSLSLLIKKGIEYAISVDKDFDFEGSMKENIESHFAQFGSVQKAYMDIKKDYSGLKKEEK